MQHKNTTRAGGEMKKGAWLSLRYVCSRLGLSINEVKQLEKRGEIKKHKSHEWYRQESIKDYEQKAA